MNPRVARGLAMVACILFFPFCVGAEPPAIQPMSVNDHFQHPLDANFYAESWNYQFMTNSQEMIYLFFIVSKVGIFSGSAGVDFTWAMSESNEISSHDERAFSDFKEDRLKGLITIGPNSMATQGLSTQLTISSERITADIAIRAWMKGFQVKDGKIDVNPKKNAFHFFFVEIPRGDFEGTLFIDGKRHDIAGSVYMDHSYTNVPATAFSSRWDSLRAFYPEYTVGLTEFRYLPDTGQDRWALGYVTDSRNVIGVSTTYTLEPSGFYRDAKGCLIPQTYKVSMDFGETQLAGTYEIQALYCRKPILGDLSWVARKLISAFAGDPVAYRFRSNTSFVLKTPEKDIPLVGEGLDTVLVLRE